MSRKILIACIFIATYLLFVSNTALADLVLDNGKPTGQWYNPQRNGEGFFVEIIKGGPNQISVAMYSFDENGDQLWVVGNRPIDFDDTVVQIEVFQFNGPKWGPDFDPADLNTIPFGTITVRFPTCDTALFAVQTDVGLQNGNYSLVRLTEIVGMECTDPPSLPEITPGTWRGEGVCFNVSEDGLTLTEVGSECDGDAAFDSRLDNGVSEEGIGCNVAAECDGVWQIEDGSFSCTGELGTLAIGTFGSAVFATGQAYEPEAGAGDVCAAVWSASPD